jgi:hypothetical protein
MSNTAVAKEARDRLDELQGEDRIRAVTMLMGVSIVERQLTGTTSEVQLDGIAGHVIDASKTIPQVAKQLRIIAGFELPVQHIVVRALLEECLARIALLEKKRQNTGELLTTG